MVDMPLLNLALKPGSATPLFEQLCDALRRRIVSGALAAETRLPPTRKLAEELGVSRTTVLGAYDQLVAEGFAEGRQGSGVYVCKIGEVELARGGPPVEEVSLSSDPKSALPFHPGQPDLRLFPYVAWARCLTKVARTDPRALIVAGDSFGDLGLRLEVCRYLSEWRGVEASPQQVLITAGSGEALELCIRTLSHGTEALGLENPCYPPVRAFADSLGRRIVNLDMDADGALPPLKAQGPKMVLLTPSSQFPLGGAMPQVRRNAFLTWATRTEGWIIEDDYDSEFRYAGQPIPALAAYDKQGRTLYVGSFSKIFSGGLRLGFVVMPTGVAGQFSETLRRFGSKASIVPQRALAFFLQGGEFYRHIRRVRRIYAERRAILMTLVAKHLGDRAHFEDHRAGMHLTVHLAARFDDKRLSARAGENGLNCPALSDYHASDKGANGLLLGFCGFTGEEMERAMETLRATIDSLD
ncbi:PLP-dependent aminotransferase family protein [Magnetospira sp. QH-2]|uniref:MocR-like pyridoxine biosynthesis transcription factor PdxR n=1 Tax=Magnetospira sp. (strain QH-2) TaxID=1288970 RepID=UPI0003E80B6B|nr:PLP-dependent aminotransferase family protein [Magnetospira sp. QH-2]CCQ74490.1 Transcriptional regulator, GntR family protein [Magnetospira sp. QH-2]